MSLISITPAKSSLKEVALIAWPLIIGMSTYTVMDITDALLVGWLGTTELAAVGIATMIALVINSFFMGFFEGVKILVAQATGAKEHDLAVKACWQGIFLAIPCGLFVVSLRFFDEAIIGAFGGPENVQLLAREYFRIRVWCAPFWYVTLAMVCYFQGIGETKIPMRINIFVCVLNVLLCLLLIHGLGPIPAMGVPGSALATLLSTIAGFVVLTAYFLRKYGLTKEWRMTNLAKRVVSVGWPVGVRMLLTIGGWTFYNSFLASLGENDLAANQIAIKVMTISMLPGYGIGEAACILVGQNIGAGNNAGVRRAYLAALSLAGLVMGSCIVLFVVFAKPIAGIFLSDPEVVALASNLLIFVAICQIFDGLVMTSAGALNGTGDTRFTMFVAIVGTWVLTTPLAYLFCKTLAFGAKGLWLAVSIELMIVAGIFIWRLRSGRWQGKALVEAIA